MMRKAKKFCLNILLLLLLFHQEQRSKNSAESQACGNSTVLGLVRSEIIPSFWSEFSQVYYHPDF